MGAPAPATTSGGADMAVKAVTASAPGQAQQQTPARGIPYYEKLRRELSETIQKKRLLDTNMANLEDSIYRFEQSYLEETGAGNIIKGFDNYIKGASSSSSLGVAGLNTSLSGLGSGTTTRRRGQVSDTDRLFSRSSASFMRDSPAPTSAHTTPSHNPTPSSSQGVKADNNIATAGSSNKSAANKKSRKSGGEGLTGGNVRKDRETEDDGKQPVKRLKITYVRGE